MLELYCIVLCNTKWCFVVVVLFFVSEAGSFCVSLALLELTIRPGWLQTHICLPLLPEFWC